MQCNKIRFSRLKALFAKYIFAKMESVLGLVFGDYGIWGFFLLLCALLGALWILFWRQKPGSGILSATHLRQPPKNLVIDSKARNAVLKQRKCMKTFVLNSLLFHVKNEQS